MHLSLTANPSHLEIVDPVVLGKVRAKQDQLRRHEATTQVLAAAAARRRGLCRPGRRGRDASDCRPASGYRTGGSIHFIVNNQIGFTTAPALLALHALSAPTSRRWSQAPIFHVNGDDPEAVVYCARVAIEFRQHFHKSVVVDMFCYRQYGHNEGDEPLFTQPLMYKISASFRACARSMRSVWSARAC